MARSPTTDTKATTNTTCSGSVLASIEAARLAAISTSCTTASNSRRDGAPSPGRRWSKALGARLVVVRPAQHVEQLGDAGVVALLGAIDRLLREVVAQHVARVGGVHAHAALGRSGPSQADAPRSDRARPGTPARGSPLLRRRRTRRASGSSDGRVRASSVGQPAEEDRHVDLGRDAAAPGASCISVDVVVARTREVRAWRRCSAAITRDSSAT